MVFHILSRMKDRCRNAYGNLAVRTMRWRNRRRSAGQVFTDIYRKNEWGGNPGEFFSGTGSRGIYVEIYCRKVLSFLESEHLHGITLVDLGCGDFEVGRRLAGEGMRYTGVDIVAPLIERNTRMYGSSRVTFLCRDLVTDDLPEGDVCLLRTVLQHLSNDEIEKILPKLSRYRYCLVTEHYPAGDTGIPNRDKPHGGDIRLCDNSAVYLDKPPFRVKEIRQLFAIPHEMGGELRTFVVRC